MREALKRLKGRVGEWGNGGKEGRKTQDAGRKEEVVLIRFPSREGLGVGMIKCESECESEEIMVQKQCASTGFRPPCQGGWGVHYALRSCEQYTLLFKQTLLPLRKPLTSKNAIFTP
jgi:hypothetical protein